MTNKQFPDLIANQHVKIQLLYVHSRAQPPLQDYQETALSSHTVALGNHQCDNATSIKEC